MFSFGNDDKEKLEENMEKIKDLVDSSSGDERQEDTGTDATGDPESFSDTPQDPEQEDFGQTESFDQPQQEQQGFDQPGQNTRSFDRPQQEGNSQKELNPPSEDTRSFSDAGQEQGSREEDDFDQRFSGQGNAPDEVREVTNEVQKAAETIQQEEEDGKRIDSDPSSLSEQIPRPPEAGEVQVPEIDKGPLFLRQQKFRRAKEMIDEMLYLSTEIERTVNHLEGGIQEDQETERDIRNILHELESDRGEVEGIISPEQE